MGPAFRVQPRAIQPATQAFIPSTMYLESLVKTTLNVLPFLEMPRNASITERSAMRLLVVSGSLIQKSHRMISPLVGCRHSTSPPAPPGVSPARPLPRHDSSA